jgi:hypothetical protein
VQIAACHCQPMNRHASRMYSFSELTLIGFVCERRQVPQLLRDQEIRICCKHRALSMLEAKFKLNMLWILLHHQGWTLRIAVCWFVCFFWMCLGLCLCDYFLCGCGMASLQASCHLCLSTNVSAKACLYNVGVWHPFPLVVQHASLLSGDICFFIPVTGTLAYTSCQHQKVLLHKVLRDCRASVLWKHAYSLELPEDPC